MVYGTDPLRQDSNGDGITDGYAVAKGLSPTVDQTGIYALVIVNTNGAGTVTLPGDLYPVGTNLTLEATGTNDMLFFGWSGSVNGTYIDNPTTSDVGRVYLGLDAGRKAKEAKFDDKG